MLFGGAIFAAGIAAPHAAADVTSASFALSGTTNLNAASYFYDAYDNLIEVDYGNQSFADSGGLGLMPFFQRGYGGNIGPNPSLGYHTGRVEVDADAALTGIGGMHAQFGLSGFVSSVFQGSGGVYARTYLRMDFDIDTASRFVLTGTGGVGIFDGRWEIALLDDLGGTVASDQSVLFDDDATIDLRGTLGAGSYSLVLETDARNHDAGGSSHIDLDFTIVPAPGACTAMGLMGVMAGTRRRRGAAR